MSYSLGIDLGTTFVTAAIATESTAEMFTLGKNSVAIPAVVHLHSDGTLISGEDPGGDVGNPGENDPDRIARELMSRLGDPTPV
ncbi:MAG: Hsp70 family protein, partial [Pseudonocardiaceae bacterium]